MLAPRKIRFEAQKKEEENIKFRNYLKCNAKEKELDEQFKQLHNELFADYDCKRCRNCCKMYHGSIFEGDLEADARHMGLAKEQFVRLYLRKNENDNTYETKHKPCDFLDKDRTCKLGECKPDSCKKYPYTYQPERLHSLYSVLESAEVCPVTFEIYEQLKKIYGFRYGEKERNMSKGS